MKGLFQTKINYMERKHQYKETKGCRAVDCSLGQSWGRGELWAVFPAPKMSCVWHLNSNVCCTSGSRERNQNSLLALGCPEHGECFPELHHGFSWWHEERCLMEDEVVPQWQRHAAQNHSFLAHRQKQPSIRLGNWESPTSFSVLQEDRRCHGIYLHLWDLETYCPMVVSCHQTELKPCFWV